MTPTERAACDKAYHKWYDTDDDGETSFDEAMFSAGLAYARAESAAELATLRQRIERLERELEFAHRTAAEIVGVCQP